MKVEMVNAGQSPVIEEDWTPLFLKQYKAVGSEPIPAPARLSPLLMFR